MPNLLQSPRLNLYVHQERIACEIILAPNVFPQPFILLLAPYAPHVAEELWSRAGHTASLTYEPWPQVDESLLVVDTVNLPVQVGACGLRLAGVG